MKTPQVPAMPDMTPLGLTNPLARDQVTIAQRKSAAPLKPEQPQKPMDIGLFSDEASQLDLIEMLMEPTNDTR